MSYTAPTFYASAFNCPHCNAFSNMLWAGLGYALKNRGYSVSPLHVAECSHCSDRTFWLEDEHADGADAASGTMVVPSHAVAPLPHPDMPLVVRSDFEEARNISSTSPRGAAALLRLCVQKLCQHLGEPGANINADIAALVKKGLPIEIQQALDIVRVVGNNAVHPGELSAADVQEVSGALFELVNHIVEDRIARPKKLAALFQKLPEGARNQIKRRDE